MVDHYTKAVLTVIAAALVGLLVQNSIFSAQAQSSRPTKVVICDESGLNFAGVSRIGGVGRGPGAETQFEATETGSQNALSAGSSQRIGLSRNRPPRQAAVIEK